MTRHSSRRLRKIPIAIAAGVAVVALTYAVLTVCGVGRSPAISSRASAAAVSSNAAISKLRYTLDPNLFTGDARRAYEIAAHYPALLAQLHCYCGCERDGSMHNLLDCYRSDHGSHCPICIGEALEAERLAKQGVLIEQIRDKLRARYANGE